MDPPTIEHLKQEWTRRRIVVTGASPTLQRFKGRAGTVMTVNMNGRALVQFDGGVDVSWYDLDVEDLKIVGDPTPGEPVVVHPHTSPPVAPPPAADAAPQPEEKPAPAASRPSSREILELARRQGAFKPG